MTIDWQKRAAELYTDLWSFDGTPEHARERLAAALKRAYEEGGERGDAEQEH